MTSKRLRDIADSVQTVGLEHSAIELRIHANELERGKAQTKETIPPQDVAKPFDVPGLEFYDAGSERLARQRTKISRQGSMEPF